VTPSSKVVVVAGIVEVVSPVEVVGARAVVVEATVTNEVVPPPSSPHAAMTTMKAAPRAILRIDADTSEHPEEVSLH
jgi:hypothetical protein